MSISISACLTSSSACIMQRTSSRSCTQTHTEAHLCNISYLYWPCQFLVIISYKLHNVIHASTITAVQAPPVCSLPCLSLHYQCYFQWLCHSGIHTVIRTTVHVSSEYLLIVELCCQSWAVLVTQQSQPQSVHTILSPSRHPTGVSWWSRTQQWSFLCPYCTSARMKKTELEPGNKWV